MRYVSVPGAKTISPARDRDPVLAGIVALLASWHERRDANEARVLLLEVLDAVDGMEYRGSRTSVSRRPR